MEKLKNQSGSTMLVTLSLMALFSILLVGFHTSIISMTARVDSTYSEKQTYLYSRSAVTALAEELIALNQQYDEDWTNYRNELEDYLNGIVTSAPIEPEMDPLLSAVDNLTANSPTLTLTDCSFGTPLADTYNLDMNITRVLESDSNGNDVVAYKLRATTTIDGINEISDTVSILLNTEGKEFEIEQESSSGGGSGSGDSSSSGFSGIYTDNPIDYGYTVSLFTGIKNGSEVVCAQSESHTLNYSINGDINGGAFKTDGDLTLIYNTSNIIIENTNFYVNGDFSLTNSGTDIKLINCNIYTTGQFSVSTMLNNSRATTKLIDCTIKSTGKNISCMNIDSYMEGSTTIDDAANLTPADLNIPSRPTPSWVNEINTSTIQDYAKGSGPMEAGHTYRLTTGFGEWSGQGLTNGIIPDATEADPITIIVPSGVKLGIDDPCGPNIRFYVEPGATVFVHANSFPTDFQADIYSPQGDGSNDAIIRLIDPKNFKGTMIVPTLKVDAHGCIYGGGSETDTTPPSTSTETIRYDLYTDYIYVRG